LYKRINQRNLVLLTGASKGLSLKEINDKLESRLYDPINDLDWALWTNFYYPMAQEDTMYERELIYNSRTLSWFANDLKKRYQKHTVS
jgi:hypothetical protein